jgi:hypothetical protein
MSELQDDKILKVMYLNNVSENFLSFYGNEEIVDKGHGGGGRCAACGNCGNCVTVCS